jgi:hypothetical protein
VVDYLSTYIGLFVLTPLNALHVPSPVWLEIASGWLLAIKPIADCVAIYMTPSVRRQREVRHLAMSKKKKHSTTLPYDVAAAQTKGSPSATRPMVGGNAPSPYVVGSPHGHASNPPATKHGGWTNTSPMVTTKGSGSDLQLMSLPSPSLPLQHHQFPKDYHHTLLASSNVTIQLVSSPSIDSAVSLPSSAGALATPHAPLPVILAAINNNGVTSGSSTNATLGVPHTETPSSSTQITISTPSPSAPHLPIMVVSQVITDKDDATDAI